MKLSNETIPYLKDEKFSDGLYLTIASPERRLVNRIDYICRYAKGKKILHVGCLDHIPLVEKKSARDCGCTNASTKWQKNKSA